MSSIYGAYNAQMGLAGAQAQANAAMAAGKQSARGSMISAGIGAVSSIGMAF
jgi:hypothetical protein